MKKVILYVIIAALALSMLAACGNSGETQQKAQGEVGSISSTGEWIGSGKCYRAENVESLPNVTDMLWIDQNVYSVATYGQGQYALAKNGSIIYTFQGSVYGIDSTEAGEIWTIEEIYTDGEGDYIVSCLSDEGTVIKQYSLGSEYSGESFSQKMRRAGNSLYIESSDMRTLVCIDALTGEVCSVSMPSGKASLARGADGQIYAAEQSADGVKVYLFDRQEQSFTLKFETQNGKLLDGSGDFLLLSANDDGLYSIGNDGKTTPIIIWDECGINLGEIYRLFIENNGEMLCHSLFGLKKLVPAEPAEINIKEKLEIAGIGASYELQLKAAQFNNASDKYYVKIVDYSDDGVFDNDQALTRLNTEILSGHVPDMICFKNISPYPYISNALLVNLNELLANDADIHREDIAVVNALELSGKMYYISDGFNLETYVARYSEFGDHFGWTLDEYSDADDRNGSDTQTLYNMTKEVFLENLACRYFSRAVDWSNMSCDFNTEDFAEILELSAKISETPEDSDSMVYGYGPTMVGTGYLTAAASWVNSVWKLAYEEKMAGCRLSCIGWPSSDGSCGSDVYLDNPLGIVSCGSNISGCWEFIKYLLLNFNENSESLPMYMPTLERAAAYARNDNSLPVQFTQEDEERFFNLLSEVNNTALYDDTLKNIIMENSSAFLNGDRSLDETIKLIQSKVSLYLAELG